PGAAERFLTDPLVTLRCPLMLRAGERAGAVFALALGHSAAEALASARRMMDDPSPALLTQTAASVIGMRPEETGAAFALLPFLAFPATPRRSVPKPELWRFGISGDLPLLTAEFTGEDQLETARKLMDLHLFLTGCGADFDLVFLCGDAPGYQKPLQNVLGSALWKQGGELLRGRRGGVHILENSPEAGDVRDSAVLCLDCGASPALPQRQTEYRSVRSAPPLPAPPLGPPRYSWEDGGLFRFQTGRAMPPRQWQQMLGNGRFGCIAVDCGCGGMWYRNARENQLVPWLGQPGGSAGVESLSIIRGGRRHSLFASPAGDCRVTYLPGAAVWETRAGGALLRVAAYVPPDTDARVLLITCDSPAPETTLHWRLDLLLGGGRDAGPCCETRWEDGMLAAENRRAIAEARPLLAVTDGGFTSWTFHRAAALAWDYGGQAHDGEPVFAASLPLRSAAVIVCGCDTPERLRALADPAAAERALEATAAHWRGKLDRFSLRSPDTALDRLMNGWLAYQALQCRLLGRCSVYQSGGAYGFRDQLQDAVNLILLDPAPAREQILRCCARQYAEGDVQHWWHEGDGPIRGVRTRCSDDLLWLPWALCEYVEKTGDERVCGEKAPWLCSEPLAEREHDRYEAPAVSENADPVLDHCVRAIGRVMSRGFGPHGLLPIGSGDWNDGFDAVGGESVWLSWFFLHVADRFAALLDRYGLDTMAMRSFSDQLARACDRAWDGDWYLRGWYASGQPLGAAANAECRIDSIAQSFAVLSGRADHEKAGRALTSAVEQLYDRENRLVKLFSPPFSGAERPGYITSYGPGFRENGGQYTHGALWLVMALLRYGRTDEAWELLRAMLPSNRDPELYRAEPYVLAADIYAAAGHEGEAGWSWYTGAAGWMFRIVTEELLGLKLRGGLLSVEPRLPSGWTGCSVVCRGSTIELQGKRVSVDGRAYKGGAVRLRKYPAAAE
ncbi:MAG: hypothetical protein IJ617_02010, partial [Oscillospiraceae bacterium]|nr:hypothetical protein [Oscillospiraceae bacterium]